MVQYCLSKLTKAHWTTYARWGLLGSSYRANSDGSLIIFEAYLELTLAQLMMNIRRRLMVFMLLGFSIFAICAWYKFWRNGFAVYYNQLKFYLLVILLSPQKPHNSITRIGKNLRLRSLTTLIVIKLLH